MARILSGADFGVQFPSNGGVANNRFGLALATQLLGGALDRQGQDDRLASQQAFATQQAEQLVQAQTEKHRLEGLFAQLERIRNMEDSPAKRTELAKLGQAEFEAGRDGSEFIMALNADTPDQFNLNLSQLSTKAGTFAGQLDEVLKANAPKTEGFKAIKDADGNILAQQNIETGEVKVDPRASKLFSPEEIQQKLQLIMAGAEATVAAQQVTPQAQATLQLTEERLAALQQDNRLKEIKIDEAVLKGAGELADANEVKQIRFNEASGVVDQINGLLEGNRFENAFGKAVTTIPELLRPQAAIDAIAEVDQIRALLSLESRQKLKGSGTISDNEQKTLEKSATVLANPLISAELAEDELIKVRRIFEDSARRNRVTPQATNQPQEIPEGATATNPTTGETITYRGGQWVSN